MITDSQITSQQCLTSYVDARTELLQCYSVTDLR